MSNPTHNAQSQGQGRRRRSRGGKNRNNRNHTNSSDHRSKQGRAEEFRPRDRGPRKMPMPAKKLTFWQKLLKAIGLYKEPAPAPRKSPNAQPRQDRQPREDRQPRSNTRNARSSDAARSSDSDKREPRERGPRGERKPGSSRGGDPSTVETARVYVGNLSYDASEQDLQELFKGVGPVRCAEVVYNRQTHRSKGYGFVEMYHQDDAVRAVEVLHDQPFMGRNMIVSGAKGKGQDERDEQDEAAPVKVVVAPLPETEAEMQTEVEPATGEEPQAIVEETHSLVEEK